MIGYERFSSLRLYKIFPGDSSLRPAEDWMREDWSFDAEAEGGLWAMERVNGAEFWYPETDGTKLAVLRLMAGPCVRTTILRSDPYHLFKGPFIQLDWAENAQAILAILGLSLQMGAAEDTVLDHAGELVDISGPSDSDRYFQEFMLQSPDPYHLSALLHQSEGLLELTVCRPDLVAANDFMSGHRPNEESNE